MTYRFLRAARNELDAAVDWYAARSATTAPKFLAAVYAVVRTVCELPASGRQWRNREDVRAFHLELFLRETLPSVLAARGEEVAPRRQLGEMGAISGACDLWSRRS